MKILFFGAKNRFCESFYGPRRNFHKIKTCVFLHFFAIFLLIFWPKNHNFPLESVSPLILFQPKESQREKNAISHIFLRQNLDPLSQFLRGKRAEKSAFFLKNFSKKIIFFMAWQNFVKVSSWKASRSRQKKF